MFTRFMDGTFITSTHFTSLWKWHFHCYSISFCECSLLFVQVVDTYTATLAEDVLVTVKRICKPLYPLWVLVLEASKLSDHAILSYNNPVLLFQIQKVFSSILLVKAFTSLLLDFT